MPDRASERRLLLLISAGCVFPALLFVGQGYVSARLNGRNQDWHGILFNSLDWLALAALTFIPHRLGRRFPFRRGRWKRAAAVHLLGIVVFSAAWAAFGLALGFPLQRFPAVRPYAWSYFNWVLITTPFGALIYSAMLGCVYAYQYFVEAREREADAARLTAQLLDARLEALRMQLNPHFLFNSLNTVLVLVRDKETAGASRMLELLADVLRQVLDTTRPREVALADELQFVERYLAIEQVRFSDRLRVQWLIEDRARAALVPDLIMQPLVENAIRHGVARRAEAGGIAIGARIAAESLELSVRDDGAGMETRDSGREGVGLANTAERLRTLYGAAGSVTINALASGGTEVLLRLPYRTARHE